MSIFGFYDTVEPLAADGGPVTRLTLPRIRQEEVQGSKSAPTLPFVAQKRTEN